MRFLRRGLFLGVAGLCLSGVVGCSEDNEKSSGILDNKGSAGSSPAPNTGPVQYNMKPASGPESFKGTGYPGADKAAPTAPKGEEKDKAAPK